MAATKLIAMHQNKGRSVMQCLKDRTDYAKNGEKYAESTVIGKRRKEGARCQFLGRFAIQFC